MAKPHAATGAGSVSTPEAPCGAFLVLVAEPGTVVDDDIRAEPLSDRPSLPSQFEKLLAKRRFAAGSPRTALEEPLDVGLTNDEALARRSG